MGGRYEIAVQVHVIDKNKAEVSIGSRDGDPSSIPPVAWMTAIEHLMTMWAMNSDAGFDRALELLVEGAKSNKVKRFHGNRADQ